MDLSKKISLKVPLAISDNLQTASMFSKGKESFIKPSLLDNSKQSKFI